MPIQLTASVFKELGPYITAVMTGPTLTQNSPFFSSDDFSRKQEHLTAINLKLGALTFSTIYNVFQKTRDHNFDDT